MIFTEVHQNLKLLKVQGDRLTKVSLVMKAKLPSTCLVIDDDRIEYTDD